MQQHPDLHSFMMEMPSTSSQPEQLYGHFVKPNTGDNYDNSKDKGESSSSAQAVKGGTDFRRRKNWSERILVELTGLLHVLSPTGKILYCSESTLELTGYRPHELVGQSLMEFLHVDDIDVFMRDFQMALHTRSQIKTHYRFRRKDDTYVIFEVVGHPKADVPGQTPQSFFGIAQPIPSKSGVMIDTFLELKSENTWLRQRIDELTSKYGYADPTRSSVTIDNNSSSSTAIPSSSSFAGGVSTMMSNTSDSNWSNELTYMPNYVKEENRDMEFRPLPTNTNDLPERKDKLKRRVCLFIYIYLYLFTFIYMHSIYIIHCIYIYIYYHYYHCRKTRLPMNMSVQIVVQLLLQSGAKVHMAQKRKSLFFLY
jgi:PAS domain S-box-containing protein